MKILFVASEAAPLVKVGGLADVVGSLPAALNSLGQEVRTIIPQYGIMDTSLYPVNGIKNGFEFNFQQQPVKVDLNHVQSGNVPVYLLDNHHYFGSGEVYYNELERFFFFSRAVMEILPHLDWKPDIVHCHDWLTAPLVMWLKRTGFPCSTVFTIHNLAFQGFFDRDFALRNDLDIEWENIPSGVPLLPRCFMAQAVLRADLVNTVSETYSREITTPKSGSGLDALLRYRDDRGELSGIMNGIDYDYWNPATDPYLPVKFDSTCIKKRELNKVELQKKTGLTVDSEMPLIGMVQRLQEQKGIDILVGAIDGVLSETGIQLVIQGKGGNKYEDGLRQIAARYPRQVAFLHTTEEATAHMIYGGCDMFLMPSLFEPCGLSQMIAMRYAALPIVRHTGGLVDSVTAFSPELERGNGFIFHEYSPAALQKAVRQALAAWGNKDRWYSAVERVMQMDFSWNSSAGKYLELYRRLS